MNPQCTLHIQITTQIPWVIREKDLVRAVEVDLLGGRATIDRQLVRVGVTPPVWEVNSVSTGSKYSETLPTKVSKTIKDPEGGTYENEDDDLTATIERSGGDVVVLLEPLRAPRARPVLAEEADDQT